MLKGQLSTRFAPAERADATTIHRQARLFFDGGLLPQVYDAITEIVMILNAQRQIVFFNRNLAELLGVKDRAEILGLRPGEALGCIHAQEHEGGCGTGDFCATCGAVQAILTSRNNAADERECRVLMSTTNALDLLVRASPLTLKEERFTVFAITDISHEKRRRALERVFFHDLLNTAAGVRLLSETLQKAARDETGRLAADVHHGITLLIDEISGQRDLASAEARELVLHPIATSSRSIVEEVTRTYRMFAEARGCRLLLDERSQDTPLLSDTRILCRVLGNMIKNAVEASSANDVVTLGYGKDGDDAVFRVHNPAYIPLVVQMQIFMRSYSTKGIGRGLGTYSMKLLTERYLEGRVSFTSTPAEGTTFIVRCPLRLSASGTTSRGGPSGSV